MGFRYELRLPDGDDAGTFEYPDGSLQAGDEIIADGNRRYRVTAVIPLELIEFVDRPLKRRARGRAALTLGFGAERDHSVTTARQVFTPENTKPPG